MERVIKRAAEGTVAAVGAYLVLTILLLAFRQIISLPQATVPPSTAPATSPAVSAEIVKTLISLATAVFWYIFVGAKPGVTEEPVVNEPGPPPAPPPAPPAPPPDPADPRLLAALNLLEQMTNRKEEYKTAYNDLLKKYRELFSALARSGVVKPSERVTGIQAQALVGRLWRNRTIRWVLLTSFLIAVAYFGTGQVQAYAYSRLPKTFLSAAPWYVLFMHTLLMLLLIPCITAGVYAWTRAEFTRRQDLSDAIALGAISVILAGFAFFLQLSPEDLRTLHDAVTGTLPVLPSYNPTVWEWRFVQRFVLFPLVGLLGPLIVMLARN